MAGLAGAQSSPHVDLTTLLAASGVPGSLLTLPDPSAAAKGAPAYFGNKTTTKTHSHKPNQSHQIIILEVFPPMTIVQNIIVLP